MRAPPLESDTVSMYLTGHYKLSKVCPELSKFSHVFDLAKFVKNFKYFWVIHGDSAKFVEQLK